MSESSIPAKLWHRYVAIGDSFTEGMSDPDPREPDAYLGWADHLASNLAECNMAAGTSFHYANLAVRGRLLGDVVGPQLDAGLALSPDLVSIVGGGNDILRPRVDLAAIAAQLETAVQRIRVTGADVLLATGAPPAFAGKNGLLMLRVSNFVNYLWGIAQRHNCYVVDMWTMNVLRDARMWGVDRLHLSSDGHQRVAQQAAWTLGLPTQGDWLEQLPPPPTRTRRERVNENAQWAREYLGPWVERRLRGTSSGDNREAKRPALTPMTSRDQPESLGKDQ